MVWIYKGIEFSSEDIKDHVGFVYLITEVSSNKKYIGQKVFFNKVAKKPLKGKTKRRISKKHSDWMDYYGSNEQLKQIVAESSRSNYHREIIRLCKSKAEMNYYELKEIMARDALISDNYYNSWVSCRINSNQLTKMNI